MYQNEIRLSGHHNRLEGGKNPRGRLEQGLTREHDAEVVVGADAKGIENLVEETPMLGRDADTHVKRRVGAEAHHKWAEFDSFRPRAENEQDFPRGRGAAICGDR